jgi:hypothetical protein
MKQCVEFGTLKIPKIPPCITGVAAFTGLSWKGILKKYHGNPELKLPFPSFSSWSMVCGYFELFAKLIEISHKIYSPCHSIFFKLFFCRSELEIWKIVFFSRTSFMSNMAGNPPRKICIGRKAHFPLSFVEENYYWYTILSDVAKLKKNFADKSFKFKYSSQYGTTTFALDIL